MQIDEQAIEQQHKIECRRFRRWLHHARRRLNGTIHVDTNVFTTRLRKDRGLEAEYAKHTVGRRVAVAPQTLAKASYGALIAGQGPRRSAELARLTSRVGVLPVDGDTIETVARLRNRCRLIGHALHRRVHNVDLWIAAAAIRWNLPLVTHDAVFIGCPQLDLRTELGGSSQVAAPTSASRRGLTSRARAGAGRG